MGLLDLVKGGSQHLGRSVAHVLDHALDVGMCAQFAKVDMPSSRQRCQVLGHVGMDHRHIVAQVVELVQCGLDPAQYTSKMKSEPTTIPESRSCTHIPGNKVLFGQHALFAQLGQQARSLHRTIVLAIRSCTSHFEITSKEMVN